MAPRALASRTPAPLAEASRLAMKPFKGHREVMTPPSDRAFCNREVLTLAL
jgi:hypothetical protein